MNIRLTPKQQRVLDYLAKQIDLHGSAPSLRQAAADLGISHSATAQFIKTLEVKGVLVREGRYSRNISLLPEKKATSGVLGAGPGWREVPIIGNIAAGLPLYAQQEWGGSVVVDHTIFRGNNLFALRIRGESMKDAGILDGDLVLCEPRQYAENGEIVVALLVDTEEATVKRFFLRDNSIELCPENKGKEYTPRRYGFGEVLIQGKVVGVMGNR